MIWTRTYHGLTLDSVSAPSERICYILLPEGLKEDGRRWMEGAAVRYASNIVVISGMEWNDDLTPWSAEGVFRKAKPFGGRAESFLKNLRDDCFPNVEPILGIRHPQRCLIGVSLSGLFAIWSIFKCDLFDAIASVSGSLWYDGFVDWVKESTPSKTASRLYASLGDREKKSKDKRMSSVEVSTLRIMDMMRGKGLDVEFVLEENTTHFSPVIPRLEKALDSLLKYPQTELKGTEEDI